MSLQVQSTESVVSNKKGNKEKGTILAFVKADIKNYYGKNYRHQ